MVSIRQEQPDDIESIRQVVRDAFSASEFGHQGEAELVDALRAQCPQCLSLVAMHDQHHIVGQIFFSPVYLQRAEEDPLAGMGLAPMAVRSDFQRRGVGTALVEAGLTEIAATGCPFVVVLGHPEYYPRFGFEPAIDHGITHGFSGIPQKLLFVKLLDSNVMSRVKNGRLFYRPEFGFQS